MIAGLAKSRTLGPSLSIVVVLALIGAFLPLNPSLRFTLITGMGWAVAAIGLDVVVGYTGQLSFGQAAFAGLGAYLATAFQINLHLQWFPAVVLAILATAVIAAVLGSVMVRLPTFGFAVVSLFFGYVCYSIFNSDQFSSWFGGAPGLAVPTYPLAGGTHATELYLVVALILAVVVIVTCSLTESQTGRALRMIKNNEVVAASTGIRVKLLKTFAFAYCCALGALGGIIYSAVVGYLGPDDFNSNESVLIFAMVVVGGAGTVGGPILGALLITVLPTYYLRSGAVSTIVFTAVLLVFLILLSDGVFGIGLNAWRRGEERLARRPVVRTALGRLPVVGAWLDPDPAAAVPIPATEPGRALAPDLAASGQAAQPPAGQAASPVAGPSQTESSAPAAEVALNITDLMVRFGDFTALDGINLTVRPGSVHAIVGPNGAGKTTLLNAISGVYAPSAGEIRFYGQSAGGLHPHQVRMLGVMRTFQHPTVVPDLSVLDNVKLGLDADRHGSTLLDLLGPVTRRGAERKLAQASAWALDKVGIARERFSLHVKDLSLSEQKRVELARGLVGQGRMLLLDEPTAGLSVAEMDSLAETLRQVHHDYGLTIVVISHHIGFVVAIADRMTVLDFGRVIADGEPAEVLQRPIVATTFTGEEPAEADGGASSLLEASNE